MEGNPRDWSTPDGTRRLPSLNALAYFEVAARTRSFAAAAKELHVTPAAISHQIKALEGHLGVELFVRHHRKVNPTPAAQTALPRLQDGFAALADAVEQIRAHSEAKWIITVCAEPLFATKWLVPRLHRFYARYPEAEIRLQASLKSVDTIRGGPAGEATFRQAGIDLAVRFGYGEYADLDARQLLGVALVPVCAPDIGGAFPLPSPRAILKQPLLGDSTSYRSPERFGWPEWFRCTGIQPSEALREQRFGNGLLALEAAVTGQGILLASRHIVQAELNTGKLIIALDRELPCPFAYYVVCPRPATERPIVHAFREWLFEEATLCVSSPALGKPHSIGTSKKRISDAPK
ncbi:LysR substrate-binding domain-containing protein [Paraburkholderia sediminicola]|uniref:LysR substrate-binding domain-containing protein n=1 Tax=Paraburkholderia sediminicola TaxID=458836 RepID=UPI0038BA5AEE